MTTGPLVSIIMPAFNAGRFLDQAIASVLAQGYQAWELLIANDASTDDTLARARAFAARDPRIRVLVQDRNRGVAAARNLALQAAAGKYIAFLDSDDLWVPDKLAEQVQFMERGGCLVSYGDYQRMDEAERVTGTVRCPPRVDYARMLRSNYIGNLTGMYNAEALGKEYFRQYRHEDYVAWLTLVGRAGEARSVGRILGRYRVYANSTSANKLKTLGWQWRIYREAERLGLLRSGYLMLCYACHALAKRI